MIGNLSTLPEEPIIDQKTTPINGGRYDRPLEIEYNVHLGGRRQPDGSFKVRYWQEVTFISPKPELQERTHLLRLSPQTALNLLDWLTQEKATLQRLAKEAE